MKPCWTLAITVWASLVGVIYATTFIVTAPKKPSYDAEFSVAVSAHGVDGRNSLIMTFRRSSNQDVLYQKRLTFDMDEVQTFGHVFKSSDMAKNKENSVYLEVKSYASGSPKTMTFDLGGKTGYIFIQTDKPLYTPGQKVKFRIIGLDTYQRLADYTLKVDIKNPQSVVVERLRYSPQDAFKGEEFQLPREATLGNWTITATYENLGGLASKVYSQSFEVREYVLPRFNTFVNVSPKIITDKTEYVTITVTSKYISGRMVKGLAEIQLGVWFPELNENFVFDYVHLDELQRGKAVLSLNITNVIPEGFISDERKHLFLNVTVTERGTMETDNVEDYSTLIVKPHHSISFTGSKQHFKPGFTYSLQAQIKDAAGNTAGNLNLNMDVTFQDENGVNIMKNSLTVNANENGNIHKNIPTSPRSHKIIIKISLSDEIEGQISGNELNISRLISKDEQYLKLSMEKPLKSNEPGMLRLEYTKPVFPSMITILIVSRGHLLFSLGQEQERDGTSFFELPPLLYKETLPLMRIVAYYYYEKREVFITDTLTLPVQEFCKEELSLSKGSGLFSFGSAHSRLKPKSKLSISARGAAGMKVGFVAIDKAVLALTQNQGFTRKSIFDQLISHDQGTGHGEGTDHDTFLKSAGLKHLVYVIEQPPILRLTDTGHGTSFFDMPGLPGRGKLGPSGSTHKLGLYPSFPSYRPTPNIQFEPEEPIILEESSFFRQPPDPRFVRNYFPESWLFEEHTLPSNGKLRLSTTVPDSITTWSIMAVGVARHGGVCVSNSIEQQVQKLFFADIRFPYKVTRLEEVKIKVVIFNYHTNDILVKVAVRGSEDICFSSNTLTTQGRNSTHFTLRIGAGTTSSHVIKVIPLRSGNPTITVDAMTKSKRDIVEKKMYVVAEGQKMRKTLTFVLDPEAKHATFGKTRKKVTTLIHTRTLKSLIFNESRQRTKINLALPTEYIKGTESCKISAFGDIMGDIINYAVLKSKSLMDHLLRDAEEVIGDLGPTVHALVYANKTGIVTDELRSKGQKFISHSIVRLLNYRDGSAFRLTTKSSNATWLTAVALKTLCHAAPVAFIDHESLVTEGFNWLLDQVNEDGSLLEMDRRLAKDSLDYKIMLSAEVLIATLECNKVESETLGDLQAEMAYYLDQNLELINDVMVLAKVTYALTLFDPDLEDESTHIAVEKLKSMMKKNNKGQLYWANEEVTEEKRKIPFWYHKGVKASSIEATAFGLLVFLQHDENNTDAIADWLVTQRNQQGVFVGALDSMAAIQALSLYSAKKHGIKVALSCKIRANRIKDFSHSFTFTEKNAIHPMSLSDVPTGDVIDVLTKGHGLGQMHVNVEYNIPIDKNAKCRFNVSIQVKYTQVKLDPDLISNPLCMYCDVNCPEVEITALNDTVENETMSLNGSDMENILTHSHLRSHNMLDGMPMSPPVLNLTEMKKPLLKSDKILSMEMKLSSLLTKKPSKQEQSYSRETLCIQVCAQYLDDKLDDDTVIEVEMLSGYEPIQSDIERLKENFGVKYAYYDREKDAVLVRYDQLADGSNCFTFRAFKEEDVRKPTPAIVSIKEFGNPVPACVVEYNAPKGKSLHLFCSNPSNINRGECKCFSGLCSKCKPSKKNEITFHDTNQLVCKADIGYQLQIKAIKDAGLWTEFRALILSVNKTGNIHTPKKFIILTSPTACPCPYYYALRKEPLYILSRDVEKMMNEKGSNVYQYLLDEKSLFLSVESQPGEKSEHHKVSYYAMKDAFDRQDKCPK